MNYKEFDTKPQKRTRVEVLLWAVKAKWKQLIVIGLLLAMSLAGIVTFRFLLLLHSEEMRLAAESEALSAVEAFNSVASLKNMFYIACFVLIIPACAVMAGLCKTAKYLSWREKVPIRETFGEGMKENFLHIAVAALVNVALLWCTGFVGTAYSESYVWKYFPAAGYIFLVLPITMWFFASTAVYKGSIAATLKNSFALTVKTYPLTLIMEALALLPLSALFIPNTYSQLAVPFLFAVYLPFFWLLWVHFTNTFFDKYININQFPSLLDKGL